MGRSSRDIEAMNHKLSLPPLRQYWQQINLQEREAVAYKRARRKQTDKARPKCRCDAYRFPHRPAGGLCRYPDPPAARWQDAQATEIAARGAKFHAKHGEPIAEPLEDMTLL